MAKFVAVLVALAIVAWGAIALYAMFAPVINTLLSAICGL